MAVPSLKEAAHNAIQLDTQAARDYMVSLSAEMHEIYEILEKIFSKDRSSFCEYSEGVSIVLYYDEGDELSQVEFSIVLRKNYDDKWYFDLSHPSQENIHIVDGESFQPNETSVQKMVVQLSGAISNYLTMEQRLKYFEIESQEKAQRMLFGPELG